MRHGASGFSLVEVLVAASILAVGLGSLAQLALLARRGAQSAAHISLAAVLAQDKMEQLRAAEWPDAASVGCCEFFDAQGRRLADGAAAPPAGTQYVRRWSVQPVALLPESARVMRVWVEPRGFAAVRLIGVRARRTE
jgi:prepilin-type N-terminal cleavage/methylation domain-containing protein